MIIDLFFLFFIILDFSFGIIFLYLSSFLIIFIFVLRRDNVLLINILYKICFFFNICFDVICI